MSALYQMRYQGVAGNGHGAMYIGKGVVVGIDISGARYNGTYSLSGTTIDGTATLTSSGAWSRIQARSRLPGKSSRRDCRRSSCSSPGGSAHASAPAPSRGY